MLYFITILIILIIVGISYYAYRIAFLAPPHLDSNHYFCPDGKQYDAVSEAIRLSVGKMASRKYESIYIF